MFNLEIGKAYILLKGKLLAEGVSKEEHEAKFPVSIADGGTGQTTLEDAKTAFGVPSLPLSVGNGGTGATTAEEARNNLGVFSWDQLYENPNPTQEMAGNVVINIPNTYNLILIEAAANLISSPGEIEVNERQTMLVYLPDSESVTYNMSQYSVAGGSGSYAHVITSRKFVIYEDGDFIKIEVKGGVNYIMDDGGSTAQMNNVMIPLRIFGTKI